MNEETESLLIDDIPKACDWIYRALNYSGYYVDYSLSSLKEIDRFFSEQKCPGGLLEENRGGKIFSIGCYIGEVFIRNLGGEWITDDDDPDGEVNISVKLPGDTYIFPVQRAMKRYQNGEEDSIYDYGYTIFSDEK